MKDRPDYVHCVKRDEETLWCGREYHPWLWLFQSAEHAEKALDRNMRVIPCEECMRAIKALKP